MRTKHGVMVLRRSERPPAAQSGAAPRDRATGRVHSFMGRGIIALPPAQLFKVVANYQAQALYDQTIEDLRLVQELSHGRCVYHAFHAADTFFAKRTRDCCCIHIPYEDAVTGTFVVASHSVEHPLCPPIKGVARMRVHSSGWVIQPLRDTGSAKVSFVVRFSAVDSQPLGASLDRAGTEQALSVYRLGELVAQS